MKTLQIKNTIKQKEELWTPDETKNYVAKQFDISSYSKISLRLKSKGRKLTPKEGLPTESNLVRFYNDTIIMSVNFDNSGKEDDNFIIIIEKNELLEKIQKNSLLKEIKEETKKAKSTY